MSRAQRASIYAECDTLASVVTPDVGGVLRTINGCLTVEDHDGRVLRRLFKSVAEVESLRAAETVQVQVAQQQQHRDPLLTRRLARLYHGLAVYLKASWKPRDAIKYFDKERKLLHALYEAPPQDDGAWHSGAKPWPQDRRTLSICYLSEAEATEAACDGKGALARRACQLYSTGLQLQTPGEATYNAPVRRRFEELQARCGWSEIETRTGKRQKTGGAAKVELPASEADESQVDARVAAAAMDEAPQAGPSDTATVVETGARQTVELRCAIGRDRLHDPAKLRGCRHRSLCNFEALRRAGNECPIVGCSARNRLHDTIRDEELKAQLGNMGTAVEYALVSGHQLKPLSDSDPVQPSVQDLAGEVVGAPPQSIASASAPVTLELMACTSTPVTLEPMACTTAAAKVARPTLLAMIDAIRTQLHLPREVEIWRVLHEGERLCCHHGEASSAGATLLDRASNLVDVIGIANEELVPAAKA